MQIFIPVLAFLNDILIWLINPANILSDSCNYNSVFDVCSISDFH